MKNLFQLGKRKNKIMNNQNFSKILSKGVSTPVGILIIVLVAVIASGGILAWQYFGAVKEKEEVKVLEEKIVEKEIKVSKGAAEPESEYTATIKIGEKEGKEGEWNTLTIYEYDGYKVGFSIDYPSKFKVSYGAIGDTPICAKRPVVIFSSLEKREIPGYGEKEMLRIDIDSCVKLGWANTFQEWIDYEKDGRYPVKKEENIIVDGKPATKLIKEVSRIMPAPEYKELLEYVYINRDKELAHVITADIDFEKQDVYLPIFEQMLSTFRFLKIPFEKEELQKPYIKVLSPNGGEE